MPSVLNVVRKVLLALVWVIVPVAGTFLLGCLMVLAGYICYAGASFMNDLIRGFGWV